MRLLRFFMTVVVIALLASLSIQFLAIQIQAKERQPSTALNANSPRGSEAGNIR